MYEIVVQDINGDRHRRLAEDFDVSADGILNITIDDHEHVCYNIGNLISWTHRDVDEDKFKPYSETMEVNL